MAGSAEDRIATSAASRPGIPGSGGRGRGSLLHNNRVQARDLSLLVRHCMQNPARNGPDGKSRPERDDPQACLKWASRHW